MTIKKITKTVISFTSALLLAGCAYQHTAQASTTPAPLTDSQQLSNQLMIAQANVAALQQQLDKANSAWSLQSHNMAVLALQKNNVQVIQVGQTVRMILSSNLLFTPGTANVNATYVNKVLPMVAQFIHHYSTTNVSVTAYSASTTDMALAKALTDKQAQVVAAQLWNSNVNARLLAANGAAATQFVSSNDTPAGRYDNNRVEINFSYNVPGVM